MNKIFVLLLFLSLTITSCFDDKTEPDPASTPMVGSIKITNNSSYAVYYLYIALSSSSTWGPEQLGANNIIQTGGGSFILSDVPVGTYDIMLKTSTSINKCGYVENGNVTSGSTLNIAVNSWFTCAAKSEILNSEVEITYDKAISETGIFESCQKFKTDEAETEMQ